jgi:deoxyribodipyrimidine photo-lyase
MRTMIHESGSTSVASLDDLTCEPRVTVRRRGKPNPDARCVVYWMQRSQRGFDNPALDVSFTANLLLLPLVAFFAPVPFYPHANLPAYTFLAQGIPDIASDLAARDIGFVLRRYPEHSLIHFCDEVKAALVVGDENPLREPNRWREVATKRLKIPRARSSTARNTLNKTTTAGFWNRSSKFGWGGDRRIGTRVSIPETTPLD